MNILGISGRKGYFHIRGQSQNMSECIHLDNYCELIFESDQPYRVINVPTGIVNHEVFAYYYRIKIRASLIHSGEDEPALFVTGSRAVQKRIEKHVIEDIVSRFILERYESREHTFYLPTIRAWRITNAVSGGI